MVGKIRYIAKRVPGLRMLARGYFKYADERERQRYMRWLASHRATDYDLEQQRTSASAFTYRPLISILVPTYNTPGQFLDEMVASVLAQTYDNWELIIVDDASPDGAVRQKIKQHAATDSRIRYRFLSTNHHIAGATNQAIKIASGEFISLFDHDDVLWPAALYEVVRALNHDDYDLIYTDEDKITADQHYHLQPFLKPAWNQDFMYSVNYITHFTTIRKSVIDLVGGENGDFSGAQDWELFLRVARSVPVARIHHVPKLLYSWRVHAGSTAQSLDAKPYVIESQRKAIEADLHARAVGPYTLERDKTYPGQWQVRFELQGAPRVLVVTENMPAAKLQTTYSNFEIVSYDKLPKIARDDDYIVFIGNNFHPRNKEWVSDMLADATRQDIGFVVATSKSEEIYENLAPLLDGRRADFVRSLSRRQVSKHLYSTARYNLNQVRAGTCMIRASKLRQAIDGLGAIDMHRASQAITQSGLRNLYNPSIKC